MVSIALNFKVFISTFLISTSLALIAFALVPGADLLLLAKLLAAALAITLSSPLWYPHVRGVRRGDRVMIVGPSPMARMRSMYGTADENGRIGEMIRVVSDDGSELKCRIVSYAGTLSKAKVKVEDDAKVVEVR